MAEPQFVHVLRICVSAPPLTTSFDQLVLSDIAGDVVDLLLHRPSSRAEEAAVIALIEHTYGELLQPG
jgi:hypothetical protein